MSGGRMRVTTTVRAALLIAAAAGTLALGGCRAGVAAAPAPAVESGGASAADTRGAQSSADPLGSVEATLDQIEKQVDQDGTG
jgi:hypothetical protein